MKSTVSQAQNIYKYLHIYLCGKGQTSKFTKIKKLWKTIKISRKRIHTLKMQAYHSKMSVKIKSCPKRLLVSLLHCATADVDSDLCWHMEHQLFDFCRVQWRKQSLDWSNRTTTEWNIPEATASESPCK